MAASAQSLDSLRRGSQATTTAPVQRGKSLAQILDLPKEKQFPAMLDSFKREIALALPAHMTPDRMARLAMTAFSQNPKLAKCEPRSVFSSVIIASQLGLEIGVDGQAFLVPYYDNRAQTYMAQLIPGWKGYVELINRAGKASVWTGAVFAGDKFEYALGDRPFVRHQPMGESDETKANLTHVYAVGRVHGAEWPTIEVWPIAKVQRHLDRYNKVGDSHYAKTNDNNFIAYGRKVALLQVQKYMPKSVELRAAQAIEAAGTNGFDLRDVLEGEWSHVAADAEASITHDAGPADTNENMAAGGASPATDSGADGSSEERPPSEGSENTSASESSTQQARPQRHRPRVME